MAVAAFPLERAMLSTGVTLEFVDIGPRDGDVLIFLHGFPESHRTWRHQLAHFAQTHRCIAPNQRGYGGSDKPAGVSDYTPGKLTADIFALADALGVARFTIIGHDWGGAIAWSVALNGQPGAARAEWAGRVCRAAIANAPHPYIYGRLMFTDPEQRAAAQYIRMFRDTAEDDFIRERGLPALMARAFAGRVPGGGTNAPEELALLRASWADRATVFGMLNWYRASPLIIPAMDEDAPIPALFSAPFPPLTIPTLIIWGLDDPALPPSNLDGIEALALRLTIERIADVGHFVTWEAPDAVITAMEAWLAKNGLAKNELADHANDGNA